MSGETIVTVVGNLTADPELRFTQSGLAVANFTIASTPRMFDARAREWKDGDALFLRCSLWREFAEQVAGSLSKGVRVIAQGRLVQRNFETKDGERRSALELQVEEIGPSLRYATAQVQRVSRGDGGGSPRQSPSDAASSSSGWAAPMSDAGSQLAAGAPATDPSDAPLPWPADEQPF